MVRTFGSLDLNPAAMVQLKTIGNINFRFWKNKKGFFVFKQKENKISISIFYQIWLYFLLETEMETKILFLATAFPGLGIALIIVSSL